MIPSSLTATPNLVEVALPSGGRAWVRRRLNHEQSIGRQAAQMRLAKLLPADVLAAADADPSTLFAELADPGELVERIGEAKVGVIVSCVWGWDGVRSPDGDELTFPADVAKMSPEDLEALYAAQEAAIESADPNAGRGRSSAPSPSDDPTPDGRSHSTRPG